ncbi:hypothetical protein BHM03_00029992 [Ensete ventricosum]|nr:hypothetical protein BHM03_00029992 [Ensete ventricosum]
MDASDQMRHSASHPLFQWHGPPLASSQQPALVASEWNAPLQQSQWERVAPQQLVTSQREGIIPHINIGSRRDHIRNVVT